jgi:hypothetical protein
MGAKSAGGSRWPRRVSRYESVALIPWHKLNTGLSAAIPVDTLVRHATRLAPYTTRPVAAEVAGEALVSTSQSYYPAEPAMMNSKLMRLAKGEVMGPGEVGDGTIVGEGPEQNNDPPLPAQQEVPADTTQAAVAPAPKVFKPINLDLSESEDEDDDMEQIA